MDQRIVGHHEAWKHQSNPNLLPNGKHLEIEFLKDLPETTRNFAEQSARQFDVASDVEVSVHILSDQDVTYLQKLDYRDINC